MSDKFNDLLAQLVQQANADGMQAQDILASVLQSLGLAHLGQSQWNSNGVSHPDADYFVQFQELNRFVQEMEAAGHGDVIKACLPSANRYACQAGAEQLPVGSDGWQGLQVDMAAEVGSPVVLIPMQGRCFKFHREPDPFFGSKVVAIPSGNSSAPYEMYDDAASIPARFKTVAEQVGYIKQRALDYMDNNKIPADPNVDFSPAIPRNR